MKKLKSLTSVLARLQKEREKLELMKMEKSSFMTIKEILSGIKIIKIR